LALYWFCVGLPWLCIRFLIAVTAGNLGGAALVPTKPGSGYDGPSADQIHTLVEPVHWFTLVCIGFALVCLGFALVRAGFVLIWHWFSMVVH